MKAKSLFLILFVCYSTVLIGQTPPHEYIPMIVSGNQWNEFAENISVPPEYQYQRTYITKIGSDTLIDGTSYFKLLTAKDKSSSIWLNNGYIREDVESQKVYYKPQKDEQEMLLYNFNVLDMQPGNRFQSYDIQSKTNVWLSVERVEYNYIGGKNRMIATMRSTLSDAITISYEDHVWIEGIGNMDGFLRSTMAIRLSGSDRMSLLCFFQNEELVYKPENTNRDDCFVYKYINRDTYSGKIIHTSNPCQTEPCLPGMVFGLETTSNNYVLTINSNWIWSNNSLIFEDVEYSIDDEVEITGTIATRLDINSNEYTELEVEIIKKSASSNLEIASSDNYTIFPNPVDNILNISCLNNTMLRIEIFDALGRQVYNQTYTAPIDVSSFSKGVYLLKVYVTNEQVSGFKIMKK